MTKQRKKEIKHYDPDAPRGRIAGIFILIIMILSLAGFAVLSGAPQSSDSNSNLNSNTEVPLGQIFKNSQSGETYWGAVRGGEQFIFQNGVVGFEKDLPILNLAENLKNTNNIVIYLDKGFNSPDSQFIIEKALNGIKKPFSYTVDSTCTKNKLILTNNLDYTGNCNIFKASKNETYRKAETLVFHLIK